MNGGQCLSKVRCVRSPVGVLSNVVGVIKLGPLDVPRRRFRFKQTTPGVISTKTSQQKLIGEELVIYLNRKHKGLTMQLFYWGHQEASRDSPECSVVCCQQRFFVFSPRAAGKHCGSYLGRVRSEGAQAVPSTEILRFSLYSFVQFVKTVAVDLVGGECQAPCKEEARKVGKIALYFRAHTIESIARRQYRAVISV